jgi:rRNA maturation RNase YbeY
MVKVKFNYANVPLVRLYKKRKTKDFIERIFTEEGKQLEQLRYIFCSDNYLLNINKTFLKHDYFTDIITFDLSEGFVKIVGEVYVSIDRVRDNANSLGTNVTDELLRVLFHGALHLCGYKDKKKSEITIMREKEDYYLSLFGQT